MIYSCAAGGCLLKFTEEILLQVARHFTLDDWAKGPARACWTLYRVHLPRAVLHFGYDVIYLTFTLAIHKSLYHHGLCVPCA